MKNILPSIMLFMFFAIIIISLIETFLVGDKTYFITIILNIIGITTSFLIELKETQK